MLKKIFSLLLIFGFAVILASCDPTNNPTPDPDPGIDYENYEYTTPITDGLKLTADYEGKEFIKDGIGEVVVSQYVDGDTTVFRSKSGGGTYSVRYNGINTPESTYKVEPWGFAASKYTKEQLKAAAKIVLQADDLANRTDNNGRYLAWVWLIDANGDSRLLNLQIVEVALGYSKANSSSLADEFSDAVYKVTIDKCRIYGQKDPDYDYSTEAKAMSLKKIREDYGNEEQLVKQQYKGTRVVISGVVVRKNGSSSCYIQQYDEETDDFYGVYLYGGFSPHGEFAVGNSVVVEGKIGYYFGSLQITEVSNIKLRAWADKDNPEIDITKKEITDNSVINIHNTLLHGSLVTLHNLTVTGGTDADATNAFTIRCSYKDGSKDVRLDVRVDSNILLLDGQNERITSYQYFSGKTFKDITAIVSYYDYDNGEDGELNGYIQLMLTQMSDFQFA